MTAVIADNTLDNQNNINPDGTAMDGMVDSPCKFHGLGETRLARVQALLLALASATAPNRSPSTLQNTPAMYSRRLMELAYTTTRPTARVQQRSADPTFGGRLSATTR